MKERTIIILNMIILLLFSGCGYMTGKIPIVGLDQNGKVIEKMIPKRGYRGEVGKALSLTSIQTIKSLDSYVTKNNSWELNEIRVGIGLGLDLGFDPIGIGIETSFNLFFRKK